MNLSRFLLGVSILLRTFAVGQQQPIQTLPVPFAPTTSIVDQMQKTLATITAPIKIYCDETLLGSATGFFFAYPDSNRLFLITNRHVVISNPAEQPGVGGPQFPDHLILKLHTNKQDFTQSEDYRVPLYRTVEPTSKNEKPKKEKLWKEIRPDVDVVAIELPPKPFSAPSKYSFGAFRPSDLLPADTPLPLGDALVIIGYPLGMSDEIFNLPIAREGTVASVFPVPFENKRFFLVDSRLHPGTSGSPVITRPTQWFSKKGSPNFSSTYVTYLVGINSGSFGDLNLNAVWFADIILELTK